MSASGTKRGRDGARTLAAVRSLVVLGVDELKRAIQTLLTNAERLPGETGTKLRNVPLGAIAGPP